jgi:hypothetical protein
VCVCVCVCDFTKDVREVVTWLGSVTRPVIFSSWPVRTVGSA